MRDQTNTCQASNPTWIRTHLRVWVLGWQSPKPCATWIDEYWNITYFASGENPYVVLIQYLDGDELKDSIREEGNVSDNDMTSKTSRIDVFDEFQIKKPSQNIL